MLNRCFCGRGRLVLEEIFGQFADPEEKKRYSRDLKEAVAVRRWLEALTSPDNTITGDGHTEEKSAMAGAVDRVKEKIFSWQELKVIARIPRLLNKAGFVP